MRETRTAHRYAKALIDLGEEMKNLEVLFKDFEFVEAVILSSRDFSLFLRNPIINSVKKKRLLREVFGVRVSEMALKFILLLVTKNREMLLAGIITEFNHLRDEKLGILNVDVKTAVAFSSGQQESLIRQIGSVTKMKVKAKYQIDPTLKGGFKVQFKDTVWDASVRHQLALLRKRFAGGTV